MPEIPAGCARPTGAVIGSETSDHQSIETAVEKKEIFMAARVGQKAPDSTAPAYYQGKFVSIKLSEYIGKWVLLCFYPGDFTFV